MEENFFDYYACKNEGDDEPIFVAWFDYYNIDEDDNGVLFCYNHDLENIKGIYELYACRELTALGKLIQDKSSEAAEKEAIGAEVIEGPFNTYEEAVTCAKAWR